MEAQRSNSHQNDKPTSMSSTEDSLGNKTVNPTSCSVEVSDGPKDSSTDSETSVCNGEKQADYSSPPQKDGTEIESTSESILNSQHKEEPSAVQFQNLKEVGAKIVTTKDQAAFCRQVPEEVQTEGQGDTIDKTRKSENS
ncbi:hypothetical protein OIU78_019884 [Salix suchowensis]|nr:hypothetical protein OIU78_019884 [Salix suchowensis]